MTISINISKLNKAQVLASLYNATHAQGLGWIDFDPAPMTEQEAAELLKERTDFDYLKGRVMKVDLSKDEFDPWLYDRDNYDGAALDVINALNKEKERVK